jgi:A/G-specific adenine glycosylase
LKQVAPTQTLATLAARLERWFRSHHRDLPWRSSYRPYEVWLSEVMLQQTRMEVVLPYFRRFLRRFPDVFSLAKAKEEKVLAVWSGLGYYRRARMLHAGARVIVARYRGLMPSQHQELLAIPGVGRYTAGAIGSIAFDLPRPIVDGHVARVLSRLFAVRDRAGSAGFSRRMWRLAASLVEAGRSPRNLNQGLMELGALICRPRNPACDACPLAHSCRARRSGRPEAFPRSASSTPPTRLEIPLYLVFDARGRMLMRRQAGKLMAGMLHLPHGNALLLHSSRSLVSAGRYLGSFRHTVTHRRIQFHVWTAQPKPGAETREELVWIELRRLRQHPHPSYVRKALALM